MRTDSPLLRFYNQRLPKLKNGDPVKPKKSKKVIIDGKQYDVDSQEYIDMLDKGLVGTMQGDRFWGNKSTLPPVVIYNSKDKDTQKFYDELKKGDLEEYQALLELGQRYGSPHVSLKDKPGLFGARYPSDPKKVRPTFNPFSGRITLGNNPDDFVDHYIGELAHQKQWLNKGATDFNLRGLKQFPRIIKNKLNPNKTGYEEEYDTPGSIEYEAHQQIEPELQNEFNDIFLGKGEAFDYYRYPGSNSYYKPKQTYKTGGQYRFNDGGSPCYDDKGNVIPCDQQRLQELGSDAYTAMQPFYNTVFEAANKYANPKTGMVSPFNNFRAGMKGLIKHPGVIFMKRHPLPDEAKDPYNTGSYQVDEPGKVKTTYWPSEWAEPRKEHHGLGDWFNRMRIQHEENKAERQGRRDRGRTGCWGANCYENDNLDQAKYGGQGPGDDELAFQQFFKTLPLNLRKDSPDYNIRGYWNALGKPSEFDYSQPKQDDGYYHAFSRNPETGEILKAPFHSTFKHAIEEDRKAGYFPIVTPEGKIKTVSGYDLKPGQSVYGNGGETTDGCPKGQVFIEGEGCVDINSKLYRELYESGKLGSRDADGNIIANLPEVKINSKLTDAQKETLFRKELEKKAFENQPQLKSSNQSWGKRVWDVATHPGTAIRAYNTTGYVPSNLSAAANNMGGPANMLNSFSPASWIKGGYRAGKQLITSPIQTPIDLGKGAFNLLGWGLNKIDSPLPGQTVPEYRSPLGDAGTNKRALEFIGNVGEAAPLFELAGPAANLAKTALRESVDLVSPVGRELRDIETYGRLNNLSESAIKNLQMQKVGITSKQREGYFPGVSEIFSEYLTPYGYDNMGKRLLDIPRRIIDRETNAKKISPSLGDVVMDQGKTLLSRPRYDAWRMYSGLPQKHGTFRLAETSPLNHPSYPKGSLDNTEIFSLNSERRLLHDLPNKDDFSRYYYNEDDLVDDLNYLKASQANLDKLNNSTQIYPSDFGTTNVMGGHNKRFFNNIMEYNDIWDLKPGNLKVEKYFGKPFMSHGQLPYDINDIQLTLGDLIKKGERLKEYPNIKINPYRDRVLEEKFDNLINTVPNYPLTQTTVIKKQKQGGKVNPLEQFYRSRIR